MPQFRCLLCLVLLGSTSLLSSQTATWKLMKPLSSPSARFNALLEYDHDRDRVVLYGGMTAGPYVKALFDTWTWDGTSWTAMKVGGPPFWEGFSTYDPIRKRVIAVGANHVLSRIQTAQWDGKSWSVVQPTGSPKRYEVGSLAWDGVSGLVLMYGRTGTRAWNGKTWTLLSPKVSPPARDTTALAYDPLRREVVLFGGFYQLCTPYQICYNTYFADTWVWNGKTWTARKPALSPPKLTGHSMAFDPNLGGVVLFGGWDAKTRKSVTDSWLWSGTSWSLLTVKPTSKRPPTSLGAAFTYDRGRQRITVFGGARPSFMATWRQTWVLDTGLFKGGFDPYGLGCGSGRRMQLSPGTTSAPVLGKVFPLRSSNFPATTSLALLAIGQSGSRWGALGLPLDLRFLGMPGCSLYASLDNTVGFPVKNGVGVVTLGLPNLSSLLALKIYMQTIGLTPKANVAGLLTSNGAILTPGNR